MFLSYLIYELFYFMYKNINYNYSYIIIFLAILYTNQITVLHLSKYSCSEMMQTLWLWGSLTPQQAHTVLFAKC